MGQNARVLVLRSQFTVLKLPKLDALFYALPIMEKITFDETFKYYQNRRRKKNNLYSKPKTTILQFDFYQYYE